VQYPDIATAFASFVNLSLTSESRELRNRQFLFSLLNRIVVFENMALLSSRPIRPEEREEMDRLCRSMRDEKDTAKLMQMLRQLQELLDRRQSEIVG
jgi:hypothetical protein